MDFAKHRQSEVSSVPLGKTAVANCQVCQSANQLYPYGTMGKFI